MKTDNKKNNGNEVAEYYDNIASTYDESRFGNTYGEFVDKQERRILDGLIDVSRPEQRLEMACGTGRLTGYATHALDASDKMMALARERHAGVQFTLASAAQTGFPDATFDVVYSFHLLMHLDLDLIGQILAEAHRILKPGGRLIVDIPSRKRRQLLHHRQESWHGATGLSTGDVRRMAGDRFDLGRVHGVMMLPVHKLPVALRRPLVGLDYALCGSFLKEYSSYLVFELIKK